jgi:hypothetical protein
MTHLERHAICEALRSADFSRSPGLRNRLRRSLASPPEWGLLLTILGGTLVWLLLIWSIL